MSGEKSEKETDDAASSDSMRFRTIPVYGCVPAAFGNTICAYVLHSLSHRTFRPSAVVPLSQDVLLKLFNRLQTKERVVFKTEEWAFHRDEEQNPTRPVRPAVPAPGRVQGKVRLFGNSDRRSQAGGRFGGDSCRSSRDGT